MHVKLPVILWAIFLCLVLAEIYFLYTSLFASIRSRGQVVVPPPQTGAVNFALYDQALEWLGKRENFVIPSDSFESAASGRANPLAQY